MIHRGFIASRRERGGAAGRAPRGGVVAAGLLLATSAVGCERAAASAPASPTIAVAEAKAPPRVEIEVALIEAGRVSLGRATRRSIAAEQILAGEVIPSEDGEADVGALVSGRIATLDVADGARVSRGQVLARIDAPDVGRATAELLRARGRGEAAARRLARQLDLEKQGATSPSAVDEARADDRAARAELTAARTMLATLGAGEPRLEGDGDRDGGAAIRSGAVSIRVAIRAPIDGVVVERSAVLGGAVAPDRSLFHLIDPARLVVRARLPETAGALPAASAPASIRPRTSAGRPSTERCAAAVIAGFGVVDATSRTLPIRLRPAAGCAWLLPGAYVDVILEGAAAATDVAAIVVPVEAVVEVRGVPTVFVVGDRRGVFVAHAVRVGAAVGASIPVEAGLDEGAEIAVRGGVLLKGELLRSALQ